MTATPPDPDPYRTPGLEPGGGVRPGDTPPDSAHATTGVSQPDPPARRSRAGAIITFILVGLVAIAVVGMVIAQLTGLIKVL